MIGAERIALGIVGAGEHGQALLAHGAPLGRVAVAAVAASPAGNFLQWPGAAAMPWAALCGDPGVRAVLVCAPAEHRHAVALAALRAGKIVVCPPPVARTAAELAAISAAGGVLLPAGEIAHCEAGRHGLAAIAGEEFGAVRSIYLAIRQGRGSGDVIADLGWEAVDFVLSVLPGRFDSVRVNAGRLFGSGRDAAVILLRRGEGPVVTLELARCLPAGLAMAGLGEVEIDVMGDRQAVRITPHAGALRVVRDDGAASVPWLDPPVLAMLRAVVACCDGAADTAAGLRRAADALAVMAAIEAALAG